MAAATRRAFSSSDNSSLPSSLLTAWRTASVRLRPRRRASRRTAGSVLAVLIVELLNSALEAAIDRISFELHELSKLAKDYGSAAVMLSLLVAGAIWAAALWQRFVA